MSQQLSDRQQQIIDVSLELISENGIQGLTIKNLAKKIGFSESAIYRHYENKIEILVAILNYFKENTERIFITALKSDEDTISKIQNLFINQFRIFTKSPSFLAVIFSEELFRNETILSERVAEIMNNNLDTLTKIIRIGQNKGEVRNDIEASHLGLVVMGTLRLFVKKWQISNHSFNLRKEGLKITQSIAIIIKN